MRISFFLLGAALVVGAGVASAQEIYPSKPVTLVVAYAPGGVTDLLARRIARDLQQTLGQPFVVENRAGAAGQVAAEYVARRPADGYTILVTGSTFAVSPAYKKSLPYNARMAFDPVALLAETPNMLLANPKLGIRTLGDVKGYAAAGNSLAFGTAGTGSALHVVGELLRMRSGLPLLHVPYKGAVPAVADLVSGQIPFGLIDSTSVDPYIKDKRIVPLVVASAKRSARHPDVPTLIELGYKDFDLNSWTGVFAPAGTPESILLKLNSGIRNSINAQEAAEFILSTGSEPGKLDLRQYQDFVRNELEKWEKVVREAGVKEE